MSEKVPYKDFKLTGLPSLASLPAGATQAERREHYSLLRERHWELNVREFTPLEEAKSGRPR